MKHEHQHYPKQIWPLLKQARKGIRKAFQAKWAGVKVEDLSKALRTAHTAEKYVCAYPFRYKDSNSHAPQLPWVGVKKRAA